MRALELSRDIWRKEIVVERTWARLGTLFSFIVLTALGANVRIPLPFTPVPITLQTFFVLLSGAVLGKRWGAATQAGYLILGLCGFPVFARAGGGIAYLLGPTGGYLIGFIISSWVVGMLLARRKEHKISQIILAMLFASLMGIYLFGLLGLSLFLQCNFSRALALGLLPFIFGDLLKIISAACVYHKIERRCREVLW